MKNISLITACKDRNNCLEAVLPSWLQYKEINEFIIVDWSSKKNLKHLTKLDSRIKVISVKNEEYYIPSQANNLGIQTATGDYILRVDTDYFLNPYYNFFAKYEIDDTNFVCGFSANCREINPYFTYLRGLLFVSKKNLQKIGGYNELINRYYAYEDDEIFTRLKLLGLTQIDLSYDHTLIHIPHPDKLRYKNFKGDSNTENNNKNILSNYYSGEELQWQTEFQTAWTMCSYNQTKYGAPKTYYIRPFVNWNIVKNNEQNYTATRIKNNLDGLPEIINCISLEESEDRRLELVNQFQNYGIDNIHFFISKRFAECSDVVTGNLSHTLSDGHKGCSVSHLKIIKQWYENYPDEPYGFFCEDDLSLETVQYWKKTWKEFISTLPSDWECVQLLYLRDNGDVKDLNLKIREWNDWSVTCYIIKREYAKKIIDRYIINNSYNLELIESSTQPLIENILFTGIGKVYSIPLFVENIKHNSTFCINPEHNVELHQLTHLNSYNKILNMWSEKKDKIVDYFTFYEPLGKEILELRINMLKNVVDEFVICESNKTQSGVNIPFKLKEIISELNFNDVNIKVIELDIPEDNNLVITEEDKINCYESNNNNENSLRARARERLQKDALLQVLNEYTEDTVFIHSDIDEIINPNNVHWIANIVKHNQNFIIRIPLVHLEGRANLRVYHKDSEEPKNWTGMFFATKRQLKIGTPTQFRSNANNPLPINFVTQNNEVLKDLGWHFSWMGNETVRNIKCKHFTHYDDTFTFLATSKYKNTDTENFQKKLLLKEGEIPPSGDKNFILKEYPIKNLPKQIFTLPRVFNFLLPNVQVFDINQELVKYSKDINNPENNFHLGYCYYQQGHTAPALSYFLRCAERTDNTLLAYEALIFGYLCYKEQKIRDETAKSLIKHAICLMPDRPEARWLYSIFYEQKSQWLDCYYHASCGLNTWTDNLEPLKLYKDFPGKGGLLFQKAISGYWWGKNEECKNILIDLYQNYNLGENYKTLIKENLQKVGIDPTTINVTVNELEPIPVIGTAIVNTPSWLERLISTIDYPVNEFVIFNNNGRNEITEELNKLTQTKHNFIKNIKVCHLPANIGCPAAWNMIIKNYIMAPYWIICNHDIALPTNFLKLMIEKASDSNVGMVHNSTGFANLGSYEIFLIKDWVVKKYGLFDENFYPGYVEDIDYTMRAINDPIQREFITELPILHGEEQYSTTGSQTWRMDLSLKEKIDNSRILNEQEYMVKKWGPNWNICQPYSTPFNLGIKETFDIDFARRKYLGF